MSRYSDRQFGIKEFRLTGLGEAFSTQEQGASARWFCSILRFVVLLYRIWCRMNADSLFTFF
jgi:hypothetical protein